MPDKDQMSSALYGPEDQLGLENAHFLRIGTIHIECDNLQRGNQIKYYSCLSIHQVSKQYSPTIITISIRLPQLMSDSFSVQFINKPEY